MLASSDYQKVREILTEAITVVCKNGLQYSSQFSVEGLLGITVDNSDIFLVNINQKIRSDTVNYEGDTNDQETLETLISDESSTEDSPPRKSGASRRASRKKRGHCSTNEILVASKRPNLSCSETSPIDAHSTVKEEHLDDSSEDIVIVKEESDFLNDNISAASTSWQVVPADLESSSREDHPGYHIAQNHSQMRNIVQHSFYPCQDYMSTGSAQEFPYRCHYSMCRFGTDRKWNLKRHLRKHENNLKYQCQLCSSRYVDTYLLRTHMIQRHADMQCQNCWSFSCSNRNKCSMTRTDASNSSHKGISVAYDNTSSIHIADKVNE